MLDVLLVILGVAGIIAGLYTGLRQTAGLALLLFGSLVAGLLMGALAALLLPAIVGGSGYLPRSLGSFGVYLLVAALGLRYVLSKTGDHDADRKLPAFLDRALGGALGVALGALLMAFLFMVGLQIPGLAGTISGLFEARSAAGARPSGLTANGLRYTNAAAKWIPKSKQASSYAPPLVVLVSGPAAGDLYACFLGARKDGGQDRIQLYLSLGRFIRRYSREEAYTGSPWLAEAVKTLQLIESEGPEEIRQGIESVFHTGDLREIESASSAMGASSSGRLKQLKHDGETLRRTIRWARHHLEEGDENKARTILNSYLAARPARPYVGRVRSEMAALKLISAPDPSAPGLSVPDPSAPGPRAPGLLPKRQDAGYVHSDALSDLKSFRYKAALQKGRAMLSRSLGEDEKAKWQEVVDMAGPMESMHRKLLQRLKMSGEPFRLPSGVKGGGAKVTMALTSSVAIETDGAVKTIAWTTFGPDEMLKIYQEAVPEQEEGLRAFRSFFNPGPRGGPRGTP